MNVSVEQNQLDGIQMLYIHLIDECFSTNNQQDGIYISDSHGVFLYDVISSISMDCGYRRVMISL